MFERIVATTLGILFVAYSIAMIISTHRGGKHLDPRFDIPVFGFAGIWMLGFGLGVW